MATGFRFKPDTVGIVRVANGEGVKEVLTAAARAGAAEVKKLGPKRRTSFFNWRASVKAIPATMQPDGKMAAAVAVDSPGWHLVEFGTAEHPALAPLRRGIVLAGIELRTGVGE